MKKTIKQQYCDELKEIWPELCGLKRSDTGLIKLCKIEEIIGDLVFFFHKQLDEINCDREFVTDSQSFVMRYLKDNLKSQKTKEFSLYKISRIIDSFFSYDLWVFNSYKARQKILRLLRNNYIKLSKEKGWRKI